MKMTHGIHKVTSVEHCGGYVLRVHFDDGTERVIDFEPVLAGELYGPLRDPAEFRRVLVDPDAHTLVWPSGADFDPAVLHDWPERVEAMRAMSARWARGGASG